PGPGAATPSSGARPGTFAGGGLRPGGDTSPGGGGTPGAPTPGPGGTRTPEPPPAAPPHLTVAPPPQAMLHRIEKTEVDKDTHKLEPVSVLTAVAEREPLQAAVAPQLKSQLHFDPLVLLDAFLGVQSLPRLTDIVTVGASIISFDQSTANAVLAVETNSDPTASAAAKPLTTHLPQTLPPFH